MLLLARVIASLALSGSTAIEDPFIIDIDNKVSSLYQWANRKLEVPNDRGISIIFQHKIILDLVDDDHTVSDIGMHQTVHDILIIEKPRFVALLEMVMAVGGKENIPWYAQAIECLSESSAKRRNFRSVSEFGGGLDCDDNGDLIGVDLSHLNLTGTIKLKSLSQTVRSLDLSFNDLDSLNLDELRGKSLEILNVENNRRCHINTESFRTVFDHDLPIRELQISSNQIFRCITNFGEKLFEIKRWLSTQRILKEIIIDRMSMEKWCRLTLGFGSTNSWNHYDDEPFQIRMLQVIDGVTNKQMIPWYEHFVVGTQLHASEWAKLGVDHCRGRGKGSRCGAKSNQLPDRFSLSGLGLEGHIDLGRLPPNILKMDLSNNNLSSIAFDGRGPFHLRSLNIQNNDNLRIDLHQLNLVSPSCSLHYLKRLDISSNQLKVEGMDGSSSRVARYVFVKEWLESSTLHGVILDGVGLMKREHSIQAARLGRRALEGDLSKYRGNIRRDAVLSRHFELFH